MKKSRNHAKSRKIKATESTSPFIRLLLCGLKATAIALLAALAIVFAGGFIGISLKDPAKCAEPIGLAAFFVSFLVCGFSSSRIDRGAPIANGLFSGSLYLLAILAIGFTVGSPSQSLGSKSILAVSSLPCSIFGAYLGNVRVTSKRRIQRRVASRR